MPNSNNSDLPWQQEGTALLLRVLVQPRASRTRCCGIHAGELKLQLTSPPVDGAANDCCREFLAKQLKLPKSAVTIVQGETSRHKRLRIEGATPQHLTRLGLDQKALPA